RIRTEKDILIEGLKKRGVDFSPQLNKITSLDELWRTKKTEMELVQSESNKVSKEIGQLMGAGKTEEANAAKNKTAQLKSQEQALKDEVSKLEDQIQALLYEVPNVPQNIVPAGKTEDDNEIVEEVGQKVQFS